MRYIPAEENQADEEQDRGFQFPFSVADLYFLLGSFILAVFLAVTFFSVGLLVGFMVDGYEISRGLV